MSDSDQGDGDYEHHGGHGHFGGHFHSDNVDNKPSDQASASTTLTSTVLAAPASSAVAAITSSVSASSTSAPALVQSSHGGQRSSTHKIFAAGIAGIVVVAVVLLAILFFLAFMLHRRRKRSKYINKRRLDLFGGDEKPPTWQSADGELRVAALAVHTEQHLEAGVTNVSPTLQRPSSVLTVNTLPSSSCLATPGIEQSESPPQTQRSKDVLIDRLTKEVEMLKEWQRRMETDRGDQLKAPPVYDEQESHAPSSRLEMV